MDEAPQQTTPTRAVRWLPAGLLGVAALFWYLVLGLVVVSRLVPLIAGWSPIVVMSGSMEPVIRAGDVVIIEPHDGVGLGVGTVVMFEDPVRPGESITHRIAAVDSDGTYITRGDNNTNMDSTPLDPERVQGVGRLLVPMAGLPLLWLREGNVVFLALLLVALAASKSYMMWMGSKTRQPSEETARGSEPPPPAAAPYRPKVPAGMARVLIPVLAVALIGGSAMMGVRAALAATTVNPGDSFGAAAAFPTFRVTTYELLAASGFTGSSYTLTLNHDLSSDYFVVMRGAAGNNTGAGNRGPDDNFARIDGDPFGNFSTSTAANQVRLARTSTVDTWKGQVTVVESLGDDAGSGFLLRDVLTVQMNAGVTNVSAASAGWSDIDQVGLYGGSRGGGVTATATATRDHLTGWAQIYPSGGATVNLVRQAGGGGNLNGTTRFTVYVVEWGSDWNIQRVTVAGSAGGNGVNVTSEYDTAAIGGVARANTFVLASGRAAGSSLSAGWGAATWTLGDGVTQNPVESVVAVGAESPVARTTEVYVHTHPDLTASHYFGPDGAAPGIVSGSLTGAMSPIAGPVDAETYDGSSAVRFTEGRRFSVTAATSGGNGRAYPRSISWSRITAATTADWVRSRTGQPGAYWMQIPDFGGITF